MRLTIALGGGVASKSKVTEHDPYSSGHFCPCRGLRLVREVDSVQISCGSSQWHLVEARGGDTASTWIGQIQAKRYRLNRMNLSKTLRPSWILFSGKLMKFSKCLFSYLSWNARGKINKTSDLEFAAIHSENCQDTLAFSLRKQWLWCTGDWRGYHCGQIASSSSSHSMAMA